MPKQAILPIGFESKEQEGFFQISKIDSAKAILHLTAQQLKQWLYLNMIDTFADTTKNGEEIYHPIPTPADIALKIGCSERRVVLNMKVLEELGLYKTKITAWEGHNLTSANAKQATKKLNLNDQSRSHSDQSRSHYGTQTQTRIEVENPSDFTDYTQTLSDPEKDNLTVNSTENIAGKNEERERENFSASNDEINPKRSPLPKQKTKQEKINSSLPLNKTTSQLTPKNQSEENNFPRRSTNKTSDTLENKFNFAATIRIPKTIAKLKEINFPFDQLEAFQKFVEDKAQKMPKPVQFLDAWALSLWESLLGEYCHIEKERQAIALAKKQGETGQQPPVPIQKPKMSPEEEAARRRKCQAMVEAAKKKVALRNQLREEERRRESRI